MADRATKLQSNLAVLAPFFIICKKYNLSLGGLKLII